MNHIYHYALISSHVSRASTVKVPSSRHILLIRRKCISGVQVCLGYPDSFEPFSFDKALASFAHLVNLPNKSIAKCLFVSHFCTSKTTSTFDAWWRQQFLWIHIFGFCPFISHCCMHLSCRDIFFFGSLGLEHSLFLVMVTRSCSGSFSRTNTVVANSFPLFPIPVDFWKLSYSQELVEILGSSAHHPNLFVVLVISCSKHRDLACSSVNAYFRYTIFQSKIFLFFFNELLLYILHVFQNISEFRSLAFFILRVTQVNGQNVDLSL